MIRLSAFADEISANLDEQVDVLRSEHISFLDLRTIGGNDVLDLTDQELYQVKQTLDAAGISVATIASPIGKVSVDSPFDEQVHRLERAIQVANLMHTSYIHVYSFYSHASGLVDTLPAARRDEVMDHLHTLLALAQQHNVILLHENTSDTYGDTIARCMDVQRTLNDDFLQVAFSPAHFIQCGEPAYPEAYQALKPWICSIHVKDAMRDGEIVTVGEGAVHWPHLLQSLQQDGYEGILSLAPQIAALTTAQDTSSVERFHRSSQALQYMLDELHWQHQ
jgi:sugar phosphate isomerase/epimerase